MSDRPRFSPERNAAKSRLGDGLWSKYPEMVSALATDRNLAQFLDEVTPHLLVTKSRDQDALPHLMVSELLYLAEILGQDGETWLRHASQPESNKFQTARQILPESMSPGRIDNGREFVAENHYNQHEAIKRLAHPSMAMAAAKASGMGENQPQQGSLYLANDVMVRVENGAARSTLLYKLPPEQFSDKEAVFHHLTKLLDAKEEGIVKITGESSNALFDAQQQIGVTDTRSLTVEYQGIDHSTLAALVFGIFDKRVSKLTKQRFWQQYQAQSTKSAAAVENLRGWQPRSGLPLETLLKVNGGLLSDVTFFKDHATWLSDGQEKIYPGEKDFEARYAELCRILRGKQSYKPVIRNYMKVRTCLEALDGNCESHPELMAAAHAVNSSFYQRLNGRSLISGVWYDPECLGASHLHLWLHLAQRYKLPSHAVLQRLH